MLRANICHKVRILCVPRPAGKRDLPFVMLHMVCPFSQQDVQVSLLWEEENKNGCVPEGGIVQFLPVMAAKELTDPVDGRLHLCFFFHHRLSRSRMLFSSPSP